MGSTYCSLYWKDISLMGQGDFSADRRCLFTHSLGFHSPQTAGSGAITERSPCSAVTWGLTCGLCLLLRMTGTGPHGSRQSCSQRRVKHHVRQSSVPHALVPHRCVRERSLDFNKVQLQNRIP